MWSKQDNHTVQGWIYTEGLGVFPISLAGRITELAICDQECLDLTSQTEHMGIKTIVPTEYV